MNPHSPFEGLPSNLTESSIFLSFKDSEDPNKENVDPFSKNYTPLKQKTSQFQYSSQSSNKNSNRSPLQDITPRTIVKKSPSQVII